MPHDSERGGVDTSGGITHTGGIRRHPQVALLLAQAGQAALIKPTRHRPCPSIRTGFARNP